MPSGGTRLEDPLQYLKGVGPARAVDFARLGINTVRDLLFTFPRDLSDRSNIVTIADAPVGEEAAILARAVDSTEKSIRGGKTKLTIVQFTDDTGVLEAVWFNSPWILDKLDNQQVLLFGKTKFAYGMLKMEHPQFEILGECDESLHIGRIVPIYPCTGKLSQNIWRKVMKAAIDTCLSNLPEIYPEKYLRQNKLMPRSEAIRNMHFPENPTKRATARQRLVRDESLLMQLAIQSARRRDESRLPGRRFEISGKLDTRIRRLFPFRMTNAQDKAIRDISNDMASERPMHRLLQGDVGCGKTAVAFYAMLAAVANKAQVVIMAPTSLLARQHYETTRAFLANSRHSTVHTGLLLGGMKKSERADTLARLASGATDILISTHSAIQESVVFKDLGLIVIDEQHKFGVRQRAQLLGKGKCPDMLVMTATPIPRSLALTVYGDLDVTVIDQLPPGRKGVETVVASRAREPDVWTFVRQELTKGRQLFVVSPLVEESEELDIKSATEAYEELSAAQLANYRLGLIHGRMRREEQQTIMTSFRKGQLDALVSTVVIEVGVDIPNANIMVILHAERFGLAQLHQLRGRIGRGAEKGHLFLMSDSRGEEALRRISVMANTSDGFEIAEEDLQIRGPGEFLGTRQHGMPELKIVDLIKDLGAIQKARSEAQRILKADPELAQASHKVLRKELAILLRGRESEAGIG